MKRIGVAVWLTLLIILISILFWYNEGIYQLPTPLPPGYHNIANGTKIKLKGVLSGYEGKPLFLHFFNPDCPCSRFNLRMFKALEAKYGNQVCFVVVAVAKKNYTPMQIKQRFDIDVPVITDDGIAGRCGIYSTPQAVLLDEQGRLYYRGNYNSSRYCIDERTAYAGIALTAFLHKKQAVRFGHLALRAYGCRFPACDQ